MGNEAMRASIIDHFVAPHPRADHVVMSRQNLAQGGAHPWVAHGCLEGAAAFATDFRQLMGPAHRDADRFALPFGESLPSRRLQYETGCAALQTGAVTLAPGASASWTFFGVFNPDHPQASSDKDLAVIDDVERAGKDWSPRAVALSLPARSVLQDAPVAVADALDQQTIALRYRRRMHVERAQGRALSFFVPAKAHNRHIVLRDKERIVSPARRVAAQRQGDAAHRDDALRHLLDAWRFGAQLTIGNTSFHKLFSVSRDPYNITRDSGLRMLVDLFGGWRLLTVPSRSRWASATAAGSTGLRSDDYGLGNRFLQ